MLLSAVSVLVVAQSSSEIPEGLTNNPVLPFKSKLVQNSIYSERCNAQKPIGTEEKLAVFLR